MMTFGLYGLSNLSTLPDRMAEQFEAALVITMSAAADKVIQDAQSQLVPGHGYDTGLLHDSLTADLIRLAAGAGIFYSLGSDAAEYWAYVEFGHLMPDGSFWPGYHYLSNAVEQNRATIFAAAYEAWTITAGVLSAEAAASIASRVVKL